MKKTIKIELFGTAYLNGKSVSYEGDLTFKQRERIRNAKKFTWINRKQDITCEATDEAAFKNGDADFCLVKNGKTLASVTTPKKVKAFMLALKEN